VARPLPTGRASNWVVGSAQVGQLGELQLALHPLYVRSVIRDLGSDGGLAFSSSSISQSVLDNGTVKCVSHPLVKLLSHFLRARQASRSTIRYVHRRTEPNQSEASCRAGMCHFVFGGTRAQAST